MNPHLESRISSHCLQVVELSLGITTCLLTLCCFIFKMQCPLQGDRDGVTCNVSYSLYKVAMTVTARCIAL